jgi:hypothetical protein
VSYPLFFELVSHVVFRLRNLCVVLLLGGQQSNTTVSILLTKPKPMTKNTYRTLPALPVVESDTEENPPAEESELFKLNKLNKTH